MGDRWRGVPLKASSTKPENLAVHGELAASMMADRSRFLLRRIGPSLEDFKDEEVELADETATRLQTLVACLNRRGTFPHGGQSLPRNGPVAPI
jgi:hypothetical protein